MPNSNKEKQQFLLIDLLENFSKKELKGLRHFASCRYFNTDQYVVKLLEILINEVLGKKKINEAVQTQVYAQVFGGSTDASLNKKEKATFNAKMNALTRLAERFLMAEGLEEKEAYKSDLLLEKLLKKKQYQLFNRHINKIQKQIELSPKDKNYHEHQLKINQHQLMYFFKINIYRTMDNLSEINRQLDLYYLLNKLDLHLSANSLQKNFKDKSYTFLHSKETDTLYNTTEYIKHPSVLIYRAGIALTIERNQKNYDKLFRLLSELEQELPASLISDSLVILTNFCAHQIRAGYTNFYQREHDLFLMKEKRNLLLENGAMPVRKFKNIVTTACHIGDYDRAEYIIETYSPFVEKKDRAYIQNFLLGTLALYQKNYEQMDSYFIEIQNSINPIYDLNLRTMIAKRDYETCNSYDCYDHRLSTFTTTEKYIHQLAGIKEDTKVPYKKFIRMLINLFNIKHNIGKKTLESVKNELRATQHISDKKWLEEKIHELETNPPKSF